MDKHISQYYQTGSQDPSKGIYHRVIALHQSPDISWSEVEPKIPHLCKGWYELSRLERKDRVEFVKAYWLAQLPFQPRYEAPLDRFFDSVEDIGIYIVQKLAEGPFEAHMVYGLKDQKGFFKGLCGASDVDISHLQNDFPGVIFPDDYLAFLKMHNGFCKTTDSGIFPSWDMRKHMDQLQSLIAEHEGVLTTSDELPIDPQNLIPFYSSFNMPFFQCFWSDWYPESEMGNVYYSEASNTISILASKVASAENMAFPTFMDWLLFYLETIE